MEHQLRETPDLRRVDALADAYLNPREVAYSVPELLSMLARGGWQMSRFYRQEPYRGDCGAITETPPAARLSALSPDEQYAAMELFRGTIMTHSVIATGEQTVPTDPLELADWESLVPVRLPSARTVAEGAPADAAAVLLNEEHTYTDLVLSIDDRELALVGGIDGSRPLGDIGPSDEKTRSFFRTLWHWDQVVFDGSATSARLDG